MSNSGYVEDETFSYRSGSAAIGDAEYFQKAVLKASIVSMADKKGDITFVNENFIKISGYSKTELIGQNHRIINSNYHDSSFWVDMWKTIARGKTWRADVKNRANDGSVYWVDTFIMPFLDETGEVREFLSISNDITERKEQEERIVNLNRSLADFQSAIEKSSIVSMADPAGKITYVNDNFIQISGYSREELLGKNHRIINSGFHPRSFWIDMWKTILSGKTWRADVKNRAKNGSYYWVDTFIMPFVDDAGRVLELLSIRNDITSRKRSEEELSESNDRLSQTLIFGKMGSAHLDIRSMRVTVSKELFKLLDVNTPFIQVMPLQHFVETYIDKEFIEGVYAKIREGLAGLDLKKNVVNTEFAMITAKGRKIWIEALGIFLDDYGLGILHDVTDRYQADKQIKEKGKLINALLTGITDGFFGTDPDLNFTLVSPMASKLARMKAEDMIGKNMLDLMPFMRQSDLIGTFRQAINTQTSANLEYQSLMNPGQYFELSVYPNPDGLFVYYKDVTERKKGEEELRKLALIANRTSNAVILTDIKGNITWVNEGFERITEYSFNEVIGKKPGDFLQGPATKQATVDLMRTAITKEEGFKVEVQNYSKSGRTYWLDIEVMPVKNNGKLTGFMAIQSDITNLKVAVSEMLKSNEMLQNITNSLSGSLIFQCITKKLSIIDFQYLSQGSLELLEVPAEDIMKNPALLYNQIYPKDLTLLTRRAVVAMRSDSVFDCEYRVLVNGKTKWLKTRARLSKIEDGKILWDGLTLDITKQKDLEESMLESEQRFRTLVHDIDVGVVLQGPKTEIFLCNPAALELLGLTEDQLLGRTSFSHSWNVIHEDGTDFPAHQHPVSMAIKTRKPFRGTVMGVYRPFTHDRVWLLVDAIPRLNPDGSVKNVIVTFNNITKMKKAEELVRESEERYRRLFELNPVPTWIYDLQTLKFLNVNDAAVRHYGYSKEEFLNLTVTDIRPQEEREKILQLVESINQGKAVNTNGSIIWKHLKKDNSIIDVEILSSAFTINNQQTRLVTVNDVTEKLRNEKRLIEALKEKELLIKEIHHRVKNNLQLISSILFIRMNRMEQGAIRSFLEETQQRIRSIALIHERLLQTGNVNRVNIADYLTKLLQDLKHSYSNHELILQLNSEIEPIEIDLDIAINCGLIMNELFTNALKHAFIGRSEGEINVSLHQLDGKIEFNFRDNGVGMSESFYPGKSQTFGMQMVDVFIKQLKAELVMYNDNGVVFKIVFKKLLN